MRNIDLSLYLVTDRTLSSGLELPQIVEQAIEGGVTVVQLREKNASPHEIKEWARKLLPILNRKNIPLIINDHPEIAKEVGAVGVHLGPKDLSPKKAREILGPNALIGLSIESHKATNLDLSQVDYIAASPVFPTDTKGDIAPPFLIEGLKKLRKQYGKPLVAIGGIHSGNLTEVLSTGIEGVAVCSAICNAKNPKLAAIQLRRPKGSPPRVLTIAGSDSGGGAGIQADLKTFQALGCYGMSVVSAITAQNTHTVRSIFPTDPEVVRDQIEVLLEDIGTDTVKIGRLFSKEIIEVVASTLERYNVQNIVLDPVMISKSGDSLLLPEAMEALKERLLPLATIITPNLPESKALGKIDLRPNQWLVLKGGHSEDPQESNDLVINSMRTEYSIKSPRIKTPNTHGTGCTYSAAIAAYLGLGLRGIEAIKAARAYLQGAIENGIQQRIGFGAGPVNHGWQWGRSKT